MYCSWFYITNGVGRRVIFSPYQFNIYIGCHFGFSFDGTIINHIMFVDDPAVLEPLVAGLNKLLTSYEDFGITYCVNFNQTKSVLTVLRISGEDANLSNFKL